jgi:hypothetical protein
MPSILGIGQTFGHMIIQCLKECAKNILIHDWIGGDCPADHMNKLNGWGNFPIFFFTFSLFGWALVSRGVGICQLPILHHFLLPKSPQRMDACLNVIF